MIHRLDDGPKVPNLTASRSAAIGRLRSRFSAWTIFAFFVGNLVSSAQAQSPTSDMHGIALPLDLCNERPFDVRLRSDGDFQAMRAAMAKNESFPDWARETLSWSCSPSDIVWANLEWWITSSRLNIPPFESAGHRQHLVVMYSPDFRRWTGMVEYIDYVAGKGWRLTRRTWLNDTPPAWRQVLMTNTLDPDVYELPFASPGGQ